MICIRLELNSQKTYKNSDEEKTDLREAYVAHRGDMQKIMETVILAGPNDIDRFIQFFKSEQKKGNLKHSKRFTKSLKTLPREADLSEAKEAEDLAKELGIKGNGDDDLKAMIISRQKQRVSFLDGLEEKYGKKRSRNKRK